MNNTTIIDLRAKAFRCEGVRNHKVSVSSDGSVRVWDSVAKHFTTCHSLSRGAVRRAKAIASK